MKNYLIESEEGFFIIKNYKHRESGTIMGIKIKQWFGVNEKEVYLSDKYDFSKNPNNLTKFKSLPLKCFQKERLDMKRPPFYYEIEEKHPFNLNILSIKEVENIHDINLIVAMDLNGGIGKDNDLLANIKPDMAFFKKMTTDTVVIMGRKTYESLRIKPLPNRINIVLSKSELNDPNIYQAKSILESFKILEQFKDKKVFVIGGASIYKEFLPFCDYLYITQIMHIFDADTFFPSYRDNFTVSEYLWEEENITHQYPHYFLKYSKNST